MTARKSVTNSDIYEALGGLRSEVGQVHEQVKYTNGRVTKLEQAEQRRTDRETFVKELGEKTPTEVKEGWTAREKTLTAMITALLAIVTALVGAGKI